jgi:hypothetical protein
MLLWRHKSDIARALDIEIPPTLLARAESELRARGRDAGVRRKLAAQVVTSWLVLRSSRCPLVACSDVIGSNVADILVWKAARSLQLALLSELQRDCSHRPMGKRFAAESPTASSQGTFGLKVRHHRSISGIGG